MSKIVYLANYNASRPERNASPAGTTVMEYLIGCLEDIGKKTVVVSSSYSSKKLPREEVDISECAKVILLKTEKKPPKTSLLRRYFRRRKHQKALFKELLNQLQDGDILLVYHSLALMRLVEKIRKKRNITLILQVCEVYADVVGDKKIREKEFSFFSCADKYIFQTEILNQLINRNKLPYVVLHGTYKNTIQPQKIHDFKWDYSKIHCVYAGTLDTRKGGAIAAVTAASFLPAEFHIHILGFGTQKEIEQIKTAISENSKINRATVSYDGCLQGEAYFQFLANCHVGLSTQFTSGAFNATSFPSKILSYMANGLRVVTVRVPAIETSLVSDDLYYCENGTPESIAEAIKNIDFSQNYDGTGKIETLNKTFCTNLDSLLKKD